MFVKRKVLHVDGKTTVVARGLINQDNVFNGEYKFEGFTYGVEMPLAGCEAGDHDVVPILGYENSIQGETCRQCGIKIS